LVNCDGEIVGNGEGIEIKTLGFGAALERRHVLLDGNHGHAERGGESGSLRHVWEDKPSGKMLRAAAETKCGCDLYGNSVDFRHGGLGGGKRAGDARGSHGLPCEHIDLVQDECIDWRHVFARICHLPKSLRKKLHSPRIIIDVGRHCNLSSKQEPHSRAVREMAVAISVDENGPGPGIALVKLHQTLLH
jgi:hypothetical protein